MRGNAKACWELYQLYPRKVGKRAALAAIDKAINRLKGTMGGSLFESQAIEHLTDRVRLYARATSTWSREDRQFIPHPATWFNQDRFDDDPREWVKGNAPMPTTPVQVDQIKRAAEQRERDDEAKRAEAQRRVREAWEHEKKQRALQPKRPSSPVRPGL